MSARHDVSLTATVLHNLLLLGAVASMLAVALAASAATVRADGNGNSNVTYPVAGFTTPNPCTGGDIVFTSGYDHSSFHVHMDGNGGFHLSSHSNLQDVTATDALGNTYRIPSTFNEEINGRIGFELTFTETFLFVSQGSAPNFVLMDDMHVTVNADGTVTSSHDNFRTACRG